MCRQRSGRVGQQGELEAGPASTCPCALCVCVCVCLPAHPFLPCEVVSQQPPCHIPDPRGQLVLVGEAKGEQGPGLG